MGLAYSEQLLSEGRYYDALSHLENNPDADTLKAQVLKCEAIYGTSNYKDCIALADEIIKKSIQLKDKNYKLEAIIFKAQSLKRTDRNHEAKSLIDSIVNEIENGESEKLKVKFLYGKSDIDLSLGLEVKSTELLKQCLEYAEKINYQSYISSCLSQLANRHMRNGNLQIASSMLERSIEIAISIPNNPLLAMGYFYSACVLDEMMAYQDAYTTFENALKIEKLLRRERMQSLILNNMGITKYKLGKFQEALDVYQNALEISTKLDDKRNMLAIYENSGRVYLELGELARSEELLNKSIQLSKELQLYHFTSSALANLGSIYYAQGNEAFALQSLEKAHYLHKKYDIKYEEDETLLDLISINISMGDFNTAKNYFTRLKDLKEDSSSKVIKTRYLLAKTLFLKHNEGPDNFDKAKEILRRILIDETTHHLKIKAMKFLCEMLIIDIKLNDRIDSLYDLIDLIKQIKHTGEISNSPVIVIEAMILQSKVELLRGDIEEAKLRLEQSIAVAENYNLTRMKLAAKDELHRFNLEYGNWLDIVKAQTPIKEIVDKSKILEYLQYALTLISKPN